MTQRLFLGRLEGKKVTVQYLGYGQSLGGSFTGVLTAFDEELIMLEIKGRSVCLFKKFLVFIEEKK